MRLIVEETLEAEVTEELGRGYYDPAAASGRGQRNGYRGGRLESAEGVIEYAVPQVRGLDGWHSELLASLCGKTDELEWLAIEMYVCDICVRSFHARHRSGVHRQARAQCAF